MKTLQDVLVDCIKDILHAEKQIVRALPKMIRAAQAPELKSALTEHLEVTQAQVERCDEIFTALGVAPKAKPCHGMMGIIEEGSEVLEEQKELEPAALDAALIGAAQKVEHYEICAYGTAKAFAEALGLEDVAELLQQSLQEEEEADRILSEIGQGSVNPQAADAVHSGAADESETRPSSARTSPARRRSSGK